MSSFQGFPELPASGEIPYCKINEVYCCASAEYGSISTFTNATKNHPRVNISIDHNRGADSENIQMYLDVENNLLKKITSVLYNQGVLEALNVAADPTVNRDSPTLAMVASYALKMTKAVSSFYYFLQPHLKDIGPKIVANYSWTRNWSTSSVKCLAWHPHTTKIAVAMADDKVYCADASFVSSLKCKEQGHVSSLAWRPLSASEIAVGCEQGVIVWTVDPNSMFSKPSSSNAIVLKHHGHSPVTDVSWSPNGDILVSCSGADTSMLVWDVALEHAVPLRRVVGGGVVFSRWSPDASKIFAATTSLVFRVWDTATWKPDRWCARGDRVVAACWGPHNMVLFATKHNPVVYSLSKTGLLQGDQTTQAHTVLDLNKIDLPSGEAVGGPILDMRWDCSGKYLALTFRESCLVAIFCTTQLQPMQIQFTPCCFVRGQYTELPSTMAWQENFSDGACLTIAWSSGRIQHFPIIYSDIASY